MKEAPSSVPNVTKSVVLVHIYHFSTWKISWQHISAVQSEVQGHLPVLSKSVASPGSMKLCLKKHQQFDSRKMDTDVFNLVKTYFQIGKKSQGLQNLCCLGGSIRLYSKYIVIA